MKTILRLLAVRVPLPFGLVLALVLAATAEVWLGIILAGRAATEIQVPAAPSNSGAIEVFFAPGPSCRIAAVETIDRARFRVRVSAYHLTSRPIVVALKRAKERGVDVQVLANKWSAGEESPVYELAEAGIPMWLDGAHPINHEKMIAADVATVLWGSANWTPSSEKDHELCTRTTSAAFGAEVEADWNRHRAHAEAVK